MSATGETLHDTEEAEERGRRHSRRSSEGSRRASQDGTETEPLVGAHGGHGGHRVNTDHGTFMHSSSFEDEDFIQTSCPSGCSRESVYRFAVVYPELHRIRKGTYYSCDVCVSLLVLVLTAVCQVCIVQIAGGWIVTQNYNQYKSSVQNAEQLPFPGVFAVVLPYLSPVFPYLEYPIEYIEPYLRPGEAEQECCHDVACSANIVCCLPEPRRGAANQTKPMQTKIKAQRLDSVCHQKDGPLGHGHLDCAQPSFQLIGRWTDLDIDGDNHWTHDEAVADYANLGCRLQLTQVELLRAVCLGIAADFNVKKDLGIPTPKLPYEIEAIHAVPREYFELWEGLAVICSVVDPARCGDLVGKGVFDGALGLDGGSWNLVSALEYCGRLLMPGGMCDKTLPVTFTLHRQSLAGKCGPGVYSAGPLYVNPHNVRDSVRAVTVTYKEVAGFELVHSFQFKFFVWIMLILWLVTLNKELESVFTMLNFTMYFPSSSGNPLRIPRSEISWHNFKSSVRQTYEQIRIGKSISEPVLLEGKRVLISDISNAHRITCWCVLILRTMDLFYMLVVGILYATCTHSYLDLLMNTVALAFVFELPELFYQWLVPEDIKEMLNNVELKPFKHSDDGTGSSGLWSVTSDMARSRFFQGLALIPIVCAAIVQLNDRWRIRPMLQVLRCACAQSGDFCEVGQHLTRDWWNGYWEKVGHVE